MSIISLSEAQRELWNAFVQQWPHFQLMQSYEWGEFKKRLGWHAVRLALIENGQIEAGAQMLIKRIPTGLASIAYIPRGPLGNWQCEPVISRLCAVLAQVARQHRAIFLRIEPPLLNSAKVDHRLQQYGFKSNPYSNQPRASIVIDLREDLEEIMLKMRKQTRRDIRRAARMGITVRVGRREDLSAFFELMEITGQRGAFSPRTRDYYRYEWETFADSARAALLMAFYQHELLAAQMVFRFGDHAASLHGASSREHAKLCPNHLLVWEAIKWAKSWGCQTYDLWGIPDQVGQAIDDGETPPTAERTDGLWGVYHFKRGFSKNIVYYVGAYDYVFFRPLYRLFSNRLLSDSVLDTVATRFDLYMQRRR